MQLDTYVEGNQVVTRAKCMTPHTIGSIDQGSTSLTIRDTTGFANGNAVLVAGAGAEGGDLVTTISSIAGNVVTLAAAAATTVRRVVVGKLTNPGTVTFTARHADDPPIAYTQAAPEVTNPSTGVWELRLVNDENDWTIHFQGTTPCHCAGEASYRIKRARALA